MSNVTNLDAGALLALVDLHAGENYLRALLAGHSIRSWRP